MTRPTFDLSGPRLSNTCYATGGNDKKVEVGCEG